MAADDKQNGKTKDCLHNPARFCCQQRILRYCAGVLFGVARCLVAIFIVIFCEIVWAQNHSDFRASFSPTKSVNVQDLYTQIEAEIVEAETAEEVLLAQSYTIVKYYIIGPGVIEEYGSYKKPLCYILGRFVGYGDLVSGLRPNYKIDFNLRTEDYAMDLQARSALAGSYAAAARDVLAMSESERVQTWNLDCPGRHGIPKVYVEQKGADTLFDINPDPDRSGLLRVLGDIEDGFSDKLNEVLQRNPQIGIVTLGSGGGSVVEAMKAGRLIRSKGLHTELWNSCYSACPLVLMGGVTRTSMDNKLEIGFHQVSINGRAVPLDSYTYLAIYEYANMMGVDGAFVVKSMWSAPPESMKVFTGMTDDVICEAGVMTWIKWGCDYETSQILKRKGYR